MTKTLQPNKFSVFSSQKCAITLQLHLMFLNFEQKRMKKLLIWFPKELMKK